MTHDNFKLISQTARELRTEAAAYTLLEAYAQNGCATYPVDSELFREIWPDEQVPGFVLRPYPHMNTHTVTYQFPECGPVVYTAEDARLIAAAPETKRQRDELVAALQEVQALIAEPFDGRGNSSADKLRAINDMCATAIAKAEGGE